MKYKLYIFCFVTFIGHQFAFTQPFQQYKLTSLDRVDKLFGQLKTDSNFVTYTKLRKEVVNYGSVYNDSLRFLGQTESVPYKDSTGQYASFLSTIQQKMNVLVQLKQKIEKQYPLLLKLMYGEKRKLDRLAINLAL